MKMTIESTDRFSELDGRRVRIWKGKSDKGVPVLAYVALVAQPMSADPSEFVASLIDVDNPRLDPRPTLSDLDR